MGVSTWLSTNTLIIASKRWSESENSTLKMKNSKRRLKGDIKGVWLEIVVLSLTKRRHRKTLLSSAFV